MENKYSLYSQGSSGWTSMKKEEFQEEDIWGIIKESDSGTMMMNSFKEPSIISKRLPTATRMIPKSTNKNPTSQETKINQHSAPLNIPDWSKIHGARSKKPSWVDPDPDDAGSDRHGFWESSWESEDESDGDEGGRVIPPHEWIARSQRSSFSVCEGAGRTLKGRDLSRVRNAVLTKTGFLESKSNY